VLAAALAAGAGGCGAGDNLGPADLPGQWRIDQMTVTASNASCQLAGPVLTLADGKGTHSAGTMICVIDGETVAIAVPEGGVTYLQDGTKVTIRFADFDLQGTIAGDRITGSLRGTSAELGDVSGDFQCSRVKPPS
jgi:hypothetical protein